MGRRLLEALLISLQHLLGLEVMLALKEQAESEGPGLQSSQRDQGGLV